MVDPQALRSSAEFRAIFAAAEQAGLDVLRADVEDGTDGLHAHFLVVVQQDHLTQRLRERVHRLTQRASFVVLHHKALRV